MLCLWHFYRSWSWRRWWILRSISIAVTQFLFQFNNFTEEVPARRISSVHFLQGILSIEIRRQRFAFYHAIPRAQSLILGSTIVTQMWFELSQQHNHYRQLKPNWLVSPTWGASPILNARWGGYVWQTDVSVGVLQLAQVCQKASANLHL